MKIGKIKNRKVRRAWLVALIPVIVLLTIVCGTIVGVAEMAMEFRKAFLNGWHL